MEKITLEPAAVTLPEPASADSKGAKMPEEKKEEIAKPEEKSVSPEPAKAKPVEEVMPESGKDEAVPAPTEKTTTPTPAPETTGLEEGEIVEDGDADNKAQDDIDGEDKATDATQEYQSLALENRAKIEAGEKVTEATVRRFVQGPTKSKPKQDTAKEKKEYDATMKMKKKILLQMN